MLQSKSIIQKKNSINPSLFINLVFGFFPISFVLGSLIVNINLLLFCCLSIFYLKSKILEIKFNRFTKTIFLFFFIVFFSTSLSLIKSFYFEESTSHDFDRFIKSILFFRFFLFLVLVHLANKLEILNFKIFFFSASLSVLIISLDIIYQYHFGFNLIGLKNIHYYNSGFFGEELVAGGYIQRFGFFAILLGIYLFKDKKYAKFIFSPIIVSILGLGILFSGNRMPLFLFIFGLCLIFLFNFRIKKILFLSLVVLLIILQIFISSNEAYKNRYYESFYERVLFMISPEIQTWHRQTWGEKEKVAEVEKSPRIKTLFFTTEIEPLQRRLFLTALDTWKLNKIFGNGIKSFRVDCLKLKGPGVNIEENQFPGKKNRLCSSHPHNYYFEILTETGIVGLLVISIIGIAFLIFVFKNLKVKKKIKIENFILLSVIISLFLEGFPLRSTGSFFTTNNATYLVLIGSILLSYKNIKN